MAGNYAFVVILPNARRFTVKTSTNSTVLEVLEQACRRHDLNADEYDLTHHNKVIDLGNSIRFSGLPNNATLEMVAVSKKRTEGMVNLGLQLENGKRLMHQFSPQKTLWEVLNHWDENGEKVLKHGGGGTEDIQPVCIYMRQEIMGKEALEKKTLRALGLTKGSAIIRFVFRSEAQLKNQANVSAPLPSKSNLDAEKKEEKFTRHHRQEQEEPMDISPSPPPPHSRGQGRDRSRSKSPSKPKEHEHKDKGHSSFKGSSSPKDPSTSSPRKDEVKLEVEEPVYHFTPPKVDNAARFSKKGELHLLGSPHDTLLYHADDVLVDTSKSEPDDSFYELSTNDVKRQYMQLQSKRKEMEDAPLQTKSARDLEKDTIVLRLLRDYPQTVVRLRFSNRFILQGCFRTSDKAEAIYHWVKECLQNQELNFYLFSAPPKKVLERELVLVEEGLVDSVVLYFGSEDPLAPADQKVLKKDYYEKISAPDAVYDFLHKKLKKKADGTNEDEGLRAPTGSGPSAAVEREPERRAPPPQRQHQPAPTTTKTPKWFKTT